MINSNNKTNTTGKAHHYLRTPLAAFFGFLAVVLIINAIFTVWLNRTLTHTPTFVDTVAPLVEKPEIQRYIAKNVAVSLVDSVPTKELSADLLNDAPISGKTKEQIKSLAQTEIEKRVLAVVSDPAFSDAWEKSTEKTHEYLIKQLESESENLTIDLTPVAQQVITQLKKTDIGIAAKELKIEDGSAEITLKRTDLGPVVDAYDSLQRTMILSLVGASLALAAAVILSVNHMKTLRRVLILTGVFSLMILLVLNVPHFVKTTNIDPVDQNAVVAITDAIFANLKTSLLVVAIVSFVVAIGSKIAEGLIRRNRT